MYYTPEEVEKYSVKRGDLLVLEGGDIGRSAIWDRDESYCVQNHVHRLRPYKEVSVKYFYYNMLFLKNAGLIAGKGIAIQGLSANALHSIVVPLPPLAEQHRIVARVEKLMAKIDELEKVENELKALHQAFPGDMKAALLQAAMQGKLTQQLPEDGNAEDLLKQIQTEKDRLVKEKKIKKEKPLAPIAEEEIPFDIPENWVWERWGNLSNTIQYGYNAPALESGLAKMVRISDIQNDEIMWDTVPFCEIQERDIETYRLHETDILFARTGGTVGKSCLVTNVPTDVPFVYAGYLIRSNYNANMLPQYLKYFMGSELYWKQLKTGTTKNAQPNCNGQTLSKMLIPIPPFAEQRRIVERLDKLLPLCDSLQTEL